jgi:uncharacterized protein
LLTPTQLSTHLACAHYTQLERRRRAGELEVEFTPDPRLEATRARGAEHERVYIERLRHAGSSMVDLRESRDPSATLAAMRKDGQVIVQAPHGGGRHRRGQPRAYRAELQNAGADALRQWASPV